MVCTLNNYETISRSTAASAIKLAPLESTKDEFYEKFNEIMALIDDKG